jgi:hypothetical protein
MHDLSRAATVLRTCGDGLRFATLRVWRLHVRRREPRPVAATSALNGRLPTPHRHRCERRRSAAARAPSAPMFACQMMVATGRRPVSGVLWAPASRRGVRWPSICAAYPRGAPRHVSRGGRAARPLCVALLRVGFAEPPGSPRTLVRSYRTVSPSPVTGLPAHRRSALCCTDPSGHPDLALASTLPGGAPTFLDTVTPCRGHPAVSPSQRTVYDRRSSARLSSS